MNHLEQLYHSNRPEFAKWMTFAPFALVQNLKHNSPLLFSRLWDAISDIGLDVACYGEGIKTLYSKDFLSTILRNQNSVQVAEGVFVIPRIYQAQQRAEICWKTEHIDTVEQGSILVDIHFAGFWYQYNTQTQTKLMLLELFDWVDRHCPTAAIYNSSLAIHNLRRVGIKTWSHQSVAQSYDWMFGIFANRSAGVIRQPLDQLETIHITPKERSTWLERNS
jgi:hypothetical protein